MAIKLNMETALRMGVLTPGDEGEAEIACQKLNALADTKATHKEGRVMIQTSQKDLVAALAKDEKWRIDWILDLSKPQNR